MELICLAKGLQQSCSWPQGPARCVLLNQRDSKGLKTTDNKLKCSYNENLCVGSNAWVRRVWQQELILAWCLLLSPLAHDLLQHSHTTLTLVHIPTNTNAIKIVGITMLLCIITPAYIITDQQTLSYADFQLAFRSIESEYLLSCSQP